MRPMDAFNRCLYISTRRVTAPTPCAAFTPAPPDQRIRRSPHHMRLRLPGSYCWRPPSLAVESPTAAPDTQATAAGSAATAAATPPLHGGYRVRRRRPPQRVRVSRVSSERRRRRRAARGRRKKNLHTDEPLILQRCRTPGDSRVAEHPPIGRRIDLA